MNAASPLPEPREVDTEKNMRLVLDAIDRLLTLFRMERIIHVVIGVVSFLLLLYGAALLYQKEISAPLLVALFGSSGLVTISSVRITFFFNKAFSLVEEVVRKGLKP